MERKSTVKNENYIQIQGFMVNELNLKGNELLIYGIIYGFSQAENQRFTGSLQYLADWTNSTKQGVQKNLKSLLEKDLIEKTEKIINGVKFCEYNVTKFKVCNSVAGGIQQSCIGGIQQSCTNNIDNNNINNNIDNKERKKEEKKSSLTDYDEIINNYTDDEELKETIYEFIKMRKLKKKPITNRALNNIINKLKENPKAEQLEMLNNSITNCWTDIYPLKEDYNKTFPVPEWWKKQQEQKDHFPEWLNKENHIKKTTEEEVEEIEKTLSYI